MSSENANMQDEEWDERMNDAITAYDDFRFPVLMFTYGTLMNGYCNNFLMSNANFIGDAVTVDEYALYTDQYPFVRQDEAVSTIKGQVFEVHDKYTMLNLDRLEDHPVVYTRRLCKVHLIDESMNQQLLAAWLYFGNEVPGDRCELVRSGDFNDSRIAARLKEGSYSFSPGEVSANFQKQSMPVIADTA